MAIEKVLRWVVIGGVFALPFVVFLVTRDLFFPFITGKNFTFRIIVEIIAAAWLALAFLNPQYRPRKSWLLAAFAIFVVIVAIADWNGVNPLKSFWSNYERMDGWVTLAHLFAYFVVASSVLTTEKLWRRLWQTYLGVSVLIGFHALLQLAGVSALGQGGAAGLGARLDATLGNPIYLAALMLFNVFIAAILWSESWVKNGPGNRMPSSLAYGSIIALDTIILFFTGTRGTTLGLVGGALLSALLLAFLGKGSAKTRKWAVGFIIGTFVLAGGFWLIRDSQFVHKVGFLDRLATISITDNTVKARFMNWGMAWQGVKERPLLGWGQEGYAVVFDKYYNPQMYAQEQWFDRVHNIIFDWLVAAGFLGLLAYLSLFACLLWCIWRTSAFGLVERSALTGLLAGYFFHNLFVFDNITSYILFTTVLAYVASRSAAARNSPILFPSGALPYKSAPIVAALAVAVVWGVAWGVNAKAYAQNRALIQAIAPQSDITKNLEFFKEAVGQIGVGTQEAAEQAAQAAVQLSANTAVPDDVKMQFATVAANGLVELEKQSPFDARFPLFLGALLGAYGDYANSAVALLRAHKLSLNKQTILFEMAQNAELRGDKAKSVSLLKQAFDLAPEFLTARVYYASALIRNSQDKLADEVLAPIIQTGEAADSRVAAAYASRGRYDKIVEIWKARVAAVPSDMQARFTLAAALYTSGNPAQAIAVLEEAARISPESKAQVDSLISEIRSGTAKVGK